MKCPHCLTEFHDNPRDLFLGKDADGVWGIVLRSCPACNRVVAEMVRGNGADASGHVYNVDMRYLIRPRTHSRPPPPKEVPERFAKMYTEACLVLSDSPMASAALSRRCLQDLLREVGHVKPGDLSGEIQEILGQHILPAHLEETVDAIRNIGNFAAHPIKSQNSGTVLDVEPGEAEWNLDVLEGLFDFFFVQPEATKRRKDALNAKLKEAGKNPIK